MAFLFRRFLRSAIASVLWLGFCPFALAQVDGAQRWSYATLSTATAGNIVGSPTVAPDGTVYIGVEVGLSTSATASGRLFALRPDGTQRWVFTAPDWVDSTPAIANDGTIYFGCWDGKIYALNPDGTQKWSLAAGPFVVSSPALGGDGTLYVGSGNGNLYAVNPDGTLKWTFPVADWIESSPAIGPDGTIYFGSWDNNFYAVRPDGTEKWRFATSSDINASPAIAADGTIYIGSRDLTLYALNPNGELKWSAMLGDSIESAPAIGADGTLYVATTGGRVFALSAAGAELWRYPRAGQTALNAIYSSPAVRADGSIVFGSSNNAVYFLNPDGTLKSRSTLGDWADSSPLVTTDGSIYIGCSDKRLYAFSSASILALTDWPQFRRDPQRTGIQPMGAPASTTGRLVNLSVRSFAGTDVDTLIVGFVVGGSGGKTLLVRGIGPTLGAFGVGGVLTDPIITAFSEATSVGANDNWGSAPNAASIATTAAAVGAFSLPSNSLDSVLLRDFAGGAYTVQVGSTQQNATGVALMEVYDAGGPGTARLINVSARSGVGTGANILISGFVVNQSTRAILVRGIGPSLTAFGVPGALGDAQLKIFRDTQLVAENNDWGVASNAATIVDRAQAVGAFPLAASSKDAVLLLTLPPGAYTAHVSGVNATTGVGLVEIYEVP